ncbi:MAG: hypothetical protein IKT77_00645 [Paludibacteraceae bacterium]|nr:hypothetical protein [Paludibacteraceae bacterium]
MRKILFFVLILFVFIGCEQTPNSGVESQKPEVEDSESEIDTGIGVENGHEYVDLGLSVKWATCNVGAETPEDYGDYFAWAETQPKSKYNWKSYKYQKEALSISDFLTKYTDDEDCYPGFADNKKVLDRADDAAYVNWKGKWRMPTPEEFQELINFCTWEKTIQNRVVGYKVTSTVEGYTERNIFLPAAGEIHTDVEGKETEQRYVTTRGYYWSNKVNDSHNFYAYYLIFYIDDKSIRISDNSRCAGYSIRPVCP